MKRIQKEPYPELDSVLDKFVLGVQTVLLDKFVGAYLVGSLATGDFDLDSDVDFLVLANEELSDTDVQSLQALHGQIHALGCYPAEHLEGSYISTSLLNRTDLIGVQPLWFVDNGTTSLQRSTHDNQWHVRWILRERALTLAGPDPRGLIQSIPAEALRGEMIMAMKDLATHFVAEIDQPLKYFNTRFGQSFAVLTSCRILQTLQTGIIQSKRSAVKWATQELDPAWHELIQHAWIERKGVRFCLKIHQPTEAKLLRHTAKFMNYAQAAIARTFDQSPT